MTDEPVDNEQHFLKLSKPVGSGTDDHGEYDLIPLSMIRGGEMKPFKVHTKPFKHIIAKSSQAPRGWYQDKTPVGRQRMRPCYTEALITSPYGGFCPVGCKFCYIDHGVRGYRATGLASVNPDYPEILEKQLRNVGASGAAYMSPYTESFQKLEDKYHVTQRLAAMFNKVNLPIFFLSRLIPPDWAMDALVQNPYSYMQWSINSSDLEVYRSICPGSFTPERLFREIERYHKAGIYVSIQAEPMLPGVVTLDDMLNLATCLRQAGADHAIYKIAEQTTGTRGIMTSRLAAVKGFDEFSESMNQIVGGVWNVRESLRREWLDALLVHTRKIGLTMSTCFEYYRDGFSGTSMGPWYNTADQCHGRGVPVHYRQGPDDTFHPLPGCYRKGCLYCREQGTQACHNEILLTAKALEYSDLRKIHIEPNEANWDMPWSCLPPDKVKQEGSGPNPFMMTDSELWKLDALPPIPEGE